MRLDAGHDVRVAVGKYDHVARLQEHLLLAAESAPAAPRCQDVIRDQMLGLGQNPGCELRRRSRGCGPGVPGLDRKKVRAAESYGAQHV
jgi:hypothetical protein